MGIADLVPGVSGGTVAFALGIHPDLLRALKTLKLSAIKHPKSVAWFLLSAILCGVLTSLALGSHLIYYLLNQPVYQSLLRALFLGLIVGSILYCIKKVGSWSFTRALSLVFGVLIALSISVFNLKFTETNSYSVPMQLDLQSTSSNGFINYDDQSKQLTDVSLSHVKALLKDGYIEPNTWIYNQQFEKYVQVESCMDFATNQYFDFKLILCGALAICAMLLPGISGSQVMQMFGSYELIIEAITLWTKQLSTGSFINPSFWVLFNVGLGILLGIATFSRFFIFLYRKYYYATLSLLVGFMFGSLPTLWPFWSLSYRVHMSQSGARLVLERLNPLLPNVLTPQTWLVFLMISLGISILLLLERIEAKKQDIDLVA
ncbi:MAG: hypothetical protein S4CHLAM7_00880 [Chlamydiae bacterium]|nr:hypothetical protein [Chlamydiota bacterium]